MSKRIFISQSNYIPWQGFFYALNQVDEFIVYDEMQYTRRDWRNRNKIKTSSGLKWLTIPVKVKGNYYQKINETMVVDNLWRHRHFESIRHSYGKSKFFKDVKAFLEDLYFGLDEQNLSEINIHFLQKICNFLKIKTVFLRSKQFELDNNRNNRLLEICKKRDATLYLSGPSARNYIDEKLFATNDIAIEWLDYSQLPKYSQLHGDFTYGVSILDLIIMNGIESYNLFK
ncbi:MAG: WbqC family protein [Flavobacteriales bacterium]|nr:WbqC family protein [Flavobacteriales bacterium]